jgi:hypothetical protein
MNLAGMRDNIRWYTKDASMSDADCDRAINSGRLRVGLRLRHPLNSYLLDSFPAFGGEVPSGYQEARSFVVGGTPYDQVSPLQWQLMTSGVVTPRGPFYFAVVGGRVVVSGTPTGYGSLMYYGNPGELLLPTDTNPVLEAFSDLWTQAALMAVFQAQQNDGARALASQQFEADLESANGAGRSGEWGQPMPSARMRR